MKKRLLITGVILIVTIIAVAVFYNLASPTKGTTIESREELINTAISTGTNWSIITETETEGYIISAACSTDAKVSLVIFKPDGNGGYDFQSSTNRNADEIIMSSVVINQNSYDLVWFNGSQTEYAELIYVIGNQAQEALKFNTSDMNIICVKSPAKEYTMMVSYYNHDGNKYE